MGTINKILDTLNKLYEILAYVVQVIRRIMYGGCEKEQKDETSKDVSKRQ